MLNEPSPSLVKNWRRLSSSPNGPFFSSAIVFFRNPVWISFVFLSVLGGEGFFDHEGHEETQRNSSVIQSRTNCGDRDQSRRLRREQVVRLHRDGANRAAHRAQSAANATRFVLQHSRTSNDAEFVGFHLVEFHAEAFLVVADVL